MKPILDWNVYEDTARKTIAEGCVLLENNGVLPLKKDSTVSVFGRIQTNYYKSGTGSGGKVNVAKVWNIVEGLEESGFVKVNQNLKKVYQDWEKENPYDEGMGWGKERWSQDEMPLTKELVADAAAKSDVAIVIIGRTAGEDKDNSATKGSYFLTDEELDMLKQVRAGFDKVAVLLNVGSPLALNETKLALLLSFKALAATGIYVLVVVVVLPPKPLETRSPVFVRCEPALSVGSSSKSK